MCIYKTKTIHVLVKTNVINAIKQKFGPLASDMI